MERLEIETLIVINDAETWRFRIICSPVNQSMIDVFESKEKKHHYVGPFALSLKRHINTFSFTETTRCLSKMCD